MKEVRFGQEPNLPPTHAVLIAAGLWEAHRPGWFHYEVVGCGRHIIVDGRHNMGYGSSHLCFSFTHSVAFARGGTG